MRFHFRKVSWKTRLDIINLKIYNPELSYSEIADILDTSSGVVKSTLTPLVNLGIMSSTTSKNVEGNEAWERFLVSNRADTSTSYAGDLA